MLTVAILLFLLSIMEPCSPKAGHPLRHQHLLRRNTSQSHDRYYRYFLTPEDRALEYGVSEPNEEEIDKNVNDEVLADDRFIQYFRNLRRNELQTRRKAVKNTISDDNTAQYFRNVEWIDKEHSRSDVKDVDHNEPEASESLNQKSFPVQYFRKNKNDRNHSGSDVKLADDSIHFEIVEENEPKMVRSDDIKSDNRTAHNFRNIEYTEQDASKIYDEKSLPDDQVVQYFRNMKLHHQEHSKREVKLVSADRVVEHFRNMERRPKETSKIDYKKALPADRTIEYLDWNEKEHSRNDHKKSASSDLADAQNFRSIEQNDYKNSMRGDRTIQYLRNIDRHQQEELAKTDKKSSSDDRTLQYLINKTKFEEQAPKINFEKIPKTFKGLENAMERRKPAARLGDKNLENNIIPNFSQTYLELDRWPSRVYASNDGQGLEDLLIQQKGFEGAGSPSLVKNFNGKLCHGLNCYVYEITNKNVCRCKSCNHAGVFQSSGVSWTESATPWSLDCVDGVVTAAIQSCKVSEAEITVNNITAHGKDCTTSQGWLIQHDTEEAIDGKCCKCFDGLQTCSQCTCPVLPCPQNQTVHVRGQCCRACRKSQHHTVPKKKCFFRDEVIENGTVTTIDGGYNCTCIHGTVLCQLAPGPPTSKPSSIEEWATENPEMDQQVEDNRIMDQNVTVTSSNITLSAPSTVALLNDSTTATQATISTTITMNSSSTTTQATSTIITMPPPTIVHKVHLLNDTEAYSEMAKSTDCKHPLPRVICIEDVVPPLTYLTYHTNCLLLHRCGRDTGCCEDDRECQVKTKEVITFYVWAYKHGENVNEELQFDNHTECECVKQSQTTTTPVPIKTTTAPTTSASVPTTIKPVPTTNSSDSTATTSTNTNFSDPSANLSSSNNSLPVPSATLTSTNASFSVLTTTASSLNVTISVPPPAVSSNNKITSVPTATSINVTIPVPPATISSNNRNTSASTVTTISAQIKPSSDQTKPSSDQAPVSYNCRTPNIRCPSHFEARRLRDGSYKCDCWMDNLKCKKQRRGELRFTSADHEYITKKECDPKLICKFKKYIHNEQRCMNIAEFSDFTETYHISKASQA